MSNFEKIRELARVCQRDIGLIRQPLQSWQRVMLRELARECGLAPHVRNTDADYIGIFQVARKDPEAAVKTAAKVQARRTDPFFSDAAPADELPVQKPAYKPDPRDQFDPLATPPAKPGIDASEVRKLIKQEVESGVLAPIQATLDAQSKLWDSKMAVQLTLATDAALAAAADQMRAAATGAVAQALRDMTPTQLTVSLGVDTPTALGLVHRDTAKIINALAAGVNVYLHGPAGSGKTTVARKVAEAFKVQFYFAAKVESEYQLLGFKDARGETVRTQFREAYEHGGVFLFDEMDASSPSAVVALNAALANGVCPFPDGIIQRHAAFKALGAGNTTLTGANRQYAGRNQLDAASIDRFAFIEFGYDDQLEAALATDAAWCKYVQEVRAVVKERGLNHLVTPRATYDGCKLLAAGMDRDTVATMVVFKGLDAATVKQIQEAMKPAEQPKPKDARREGVAIGLRPYQQAAINAMLNGKPF